MHWYSFADAENQRAREQAKAQKNQSNKIGVYQKTVGNLGEIAFARFCEDYLPANAWEWKNSDAMDNGQPEFSSSDFEVAATMVDVKATTEVENLNPKQWIMGYGLSGDSGVYVFVLITKNREKAAILGWAHYRDLTDSARTDTTKTSFTYFYLRNMYELLALLNVAPE